MTRCGFVFRVRLVCYVGNGGDIVLMRSQLGSFYVVVFHRFFTGFQLNLVSISKHDECALGPLSLDGPVLLNALQHLTELRKTHLDC